MIKITLALMGLILSLGANATIVSLDSPFGTNTITRDTVAGLDWLDVTETRGLSYNEVTAQLDAGGAYAGYRYATMAELDQLIINFGYMAIRQICDYTSLHCDTDIEPDSELVEQMIRTLGDTINESWDSTDNVTDIDPSGAGYTWGILGSKNRDGTSQDTAMIHDGQYIHRDTGLPKTNGRDDVQTARSGESQTWTRHDAGSYLVAPSPVPAANINIVAIEGGGDVVITASGSIDLTGLTPTGNVLLTSAISPSTGEFWLGASQGRTYAGFSSAPEPFGSGSQTGGTPIQPFLFGIYNGDLLVPNAYISNAPYENTSTWAGESFASLGMDVGSYLYTLTNGQTVLLEVSDDADDDGVTDDVDNCTLVSNPTQCDGDGDDYGNHCDADFNSDGITNGLDIGPLKVAFGTADPVTDLNCDGIVNGLDIGPLKAMFGTAPGPSGLVP